MSVTKTNNLRKGSQGSDVLELQKLLNKNGYNLAEDGSFGSKTLDAVRDFQKNNGLSVDGIVGTNTWGKLNSSNKTNTASSTASQTKTGASAVGIVPDYAKYTYDPNTDDAYMQALSALKAAEGNLPTYDDTLDKQALEAYNKIMNKEKFSYDVNSDALYQQYKDQYTTQGKLAMMDTMGQAAAMNGGYGSSYAQSVGQQAYQGYLQQLNEVVPELYQMAYGQYENEVQDLYDQYNLLDNRAKDEYTKYQNDLDQYWKTINDLKDTADTAYDRGFNKWYTSVTLGNEADETAYTRKQNAYDNLVNLITVSGYVPTAEELQEAGMTAEQAKSLKTHYTNSLNQGSGKTGKGSSGGDDGGDDTGKTPTGSVGDSDVKAMQKALGVDDDGKWGPKTQAAAKAQWGVTSVEEAWKKYQENGGGGSGFTGTTYSEAVAYLKKNGVAGSTASGIMTSSEWSRRKQSHKKNGNGGAEVSEFDSYDEYLQYIVEYHLENGD